MENLRPYKPKHQSITKFLFENKIVLMLADKEKRTASYHKFDYQNEKYFCIVMDSKMTSKKKFSVIKFLVDYAIDRQKKPDCIYVDKRYELDGDVYLSKKMNIRIKRIDRTVKNALIAYHYCKIKELLYKYDFDDFYRQYQSASNNEYVDSVVSKMKRGVIKGTFDEYCYIETIKNIIHLYEKEVDNRINYENPSFNDNMLFKYLDNYFSKYIVVEYDNELVKNFIMKYYITEIQSEDLSYSFVDELLSFYKMIRNARFSWDNSYQFSLKKISLYSSRRARKIKYKSFYKYFDQIMEDDENYYNFMFLLEILELKKRSSDKKAIINYISVLDLLLVENDRQISSQIQWKITKLLPNKSYEKIELSKIYNYRSKIIHGDYKKSIKILEELSEFEKYKLTAKEIEFDIYSNKGQLIEEKVKEELYKLLTDILRLFIFHNSKIRKIKKIFVEES